MEDTIIGVLVNQASADKETKAIITNIKGEVLIKEGRKWKKGEILMVLKEEVMIKTGKKGEARILLPTGEVKSLKGNERYVIKPSMKEKDIGLGKIFKNLQELLKSKPKESIFEVGGIKRKNSNYPY
ncbi:MAG: hypothetical protein AB1397_06435 [bacterium]